MWWTTRLIHTQNMLYFHFFQAISGCSLRKYHSHENVSATGNFWFWNFTENENTTFQKHLISWYKKKTTQTILRNILNTQAVWFRGWVPNHFWRFNSLVFSCSLFVSGFLSSSSIISIVLNSNSALEKQCVFISIWEPHRVRKETASFVLELKNSTMCPLQSICGFTQKSMTHVQTVSSFMYLQILTQQTISMKTWESLTAMHSQLPCLKTLVTSQWAPMCASCAALWENNGFKPASDFHFFNLCWTFDF